MRSESRIWEIRPFGSMRGGSELVIGLCASQSNRSRLLYYSGLVGITRDHSTAWSRQRWPTKVAMLVGIPPGPGPVTSLQPLQTLTILTLGPVTAPLPGGYKRYIQTRRMLKSW